MTQDRVARRQKKLTLYEQSFTPCSEHTPNVDLDSGELCPRGDTFDCICRRVTWRTYLAHSPTFKDCAACRQATQETARIYAIGQANRRQAFRLADLRWWYQKVAEANWPRRLQDWKRATADWELA